MCVQNSSSLLKSPTYTNLTLTYPHKYRHAINCFNWGEYSNFRTKSGQLRVSLTPIAGENCVSLGVNK